MPLFDTHAHVFLSAKSNAEVLDVIERFKGVGGGKILMPALDMATSEQVIELCAKFPVLTCAVGIHPTHAQDLDLADVQNTIDHLRKLIQNNRPYICAIGEAGLDDHHTSSDPEVRNTQLAVQTAYFEAQMALAKEFDLPIIVHSRNCPDMTLDLIVKNGCRKCVIHCFSESLNFAKELFAFSSDAKISFTGLLTYPQATNIADVASQVPLERIMIETDSPYLVPQNMRKSGIKTCQSAYVEEVMNKLISLRTEDEATVRQTVWETSCVFFAVQ